MTIIRAFTSLVGGKIKRLRAERAALLLQLEYVRHQRDFYKGLYDNIHEDANAMARLLPASVVWVNAERELSALRIKLAASERQRRELDASMRRKHMR